MEDTEITMDTNTEDILLELRTLNQNFTEFFDYIKERDSLSDEEKESVIQADKEKDSRFQEYLKSEEKYKETLLTHTEKLSNIDSYIRSLQESEKNPSEFDTSVQGYLSNMEFNSSYQVILNFIIIGMLGLILGMFLIKSILRKL